MIQKVLEVKKTIAYVVGLVAQLLTLGLVPHPYVAAVTGVIAVATGLGIYQADNADPAPPGDHAA